MRGPAWSPRHPRSGRQARTVTGFGPSLITSEESLHVEGLQAVDILERLQIVLVSPRELHDRQVMSLGNKHRSCVVPSSATFCALPSRPSGPSAMPTTCTGSTGSPR